MKATTVTFARPSDPMMPEGNDAETAMRQSLGLGTASSPAPAAPRAGDPMRGARQAIRSQAAAREYVERQLVHAEATIQELRTKLHHARREKDAAVEAARLATMAKRGSRLKPSKFLKVFEINGVGLDWRARVGRVRSNLNRHRSVDRDTAA
jgi:hypothetical protein